MDTDAEKLKKAEKTARIASLLTFCIAAFSLTIALISMRNMHTSVYGFVEYCSFVHFGLMVLFGAMFLLKSRAFAIMLLIYYCISRIVLAAIISLSGVAFTVDFFIGLAYIVVIFYGLGATVEYQRIMKGLMKNTQTVVQDPNAGPATQDLGQKNYYVNQQQAPGYRGPQEHDANQQDYTGQQNQDPHGGAGYPYHSPPPALKKQVYNTSIALGSIAIFLFWLLGVVSIALGTVGIILSLKNRDAYQSLPGFVLSLIGLVLGVLVALFIITARIQL